MIDKLLVKDRLRMIAEFYIELGELKNLPKDEFFTTRNSAAAESFLRRSLEAVFDIGRHILSKSGGIELAKEYKGIATGLGEKNIVTKELANKLVKMAGYRNRLVHLYHQVGKEEMYSILLNNLDDLKEFVKQVSEYIE